MLQISTLKPFHKKVLDDKIILTFAYMYLSVVKDDELYHFVPTEGKEMIIDKITGEIQNPSEIFVFQRGNRFIRLPLYKFLLVSNAHEHLKEYLYTQPTELKNHNHLLQKGPDGNYTTVENPRLAKELEMININRLIDDALDNRDEKEFYNLTERRKKLEEELNLL